MVIGLTPKMDIATAGTAGGGERWYHPKGCTSGSVSTGKGQKDEGGKITGRGGGREGTERGWDGPVRTMNQSHETVHNFSLVFQCSLAHVLHPLLSLSHPPASAVVSSFTYFHLIPPPLCLPACTHPFFFMKESSSVVQKENKSS